MLDKKQTPKPKNKQNRQKHQKANNTNQTQKQKHHGRWSADQFMDNWKITLYHLRDWYGNVKQKRNNQTTKCHTIICEPGSNKCTMRKPRLPPARSPEITECKPHGQHSHTFMNTIQKPARRCLVASDKKTLKGETWCESGAKVRRQKPKALRGHSESSHVCHQP